MIGANIYSVGSIPFLNMTWGYWILYCAQLDIPHAEDNVFSPNVSSTRFVSGKIFVPY
jgi:hypothetical protein